MRKLTKKIAAVVLSAAMVGGVLAGCSATKDNNEGAEKKTSYKIGICQLVQHTALDAATKGFEDKLKELGEADGITFEFDAEKEQRIFQKLTLIKKGALTNYSAPNAPLHINKNITGK